MILPVFLLLLSFLAVVSSSSFPPRDKMPQIIAHRGASGYVPEHSLAAYRLAMDLKTDFIEPDFCLSKDGVFVALHDLLLDDTTNVATFPEYADRKTTKVVDGKSMSGYFVSDFLLSELKSLRLNQRLAGRSTLFNGLLQIPTLSEIHDLLQSQFDSNGITIGMYPELKHPSYFMELGFPMDDMFLKELALLGYAVEGPNVPRNLSQVNPVVIQCFDAAVLRQLGAKTSLPLVLLLDIPVEDSWTVANLTDYSTFVDGVGPEKQFLSAVSYEKGVQYMKMAHDLGLYVHPWTFRADYKIAPKFGDNFEQEEMYYICCLQVDAFFSEFPDRSRESVDDYLGFRAVNKAPSCGGLNCNNF